MNYLLKNILIAFLAFLTIAGLFALTSETGQKLKEISLNQLVDQINQEQISEIIIRGEILDIGLKNGEIEKATKEKETSLTESLKNYNVDSEKLKLINLEIKEKAD